MKIIEGLKKLKDLARKADDIRSKIKDNCADLDISVPTYGTVEAQFAQIAGWLQAHHDIVDEIANLRTRIQATNLCTPVVVEVKDGVRIEKSISAWIHRRKDLAKMEEVAWAGLTSRGIQAKPFKESEKSEEIKVANVRKFYDQKKRDEMVEEYRSEPLRIDAALEVANAVTDLID